MALRGKPAVHRDRAKKLFDQAYAGAEGAISWARIGDCHAAHLSLLGAFESRGAALEAARSGRLTDKQRRTQFKYGWDKTAEAHRVVTKACPIKRGRYS